MLSGSVTVKAKVKLNVKNCGDGTILTRVAFQYDDGEQSEWTDWRVLREMQTIELTLPYDYKLEWGNDG